MDNSLKVLKHRQLDLFGSMASILGVLASPVRLQLIHFLSQAPLTVEVLALKVDQSVANTSMHLRKMHGEGLVSVETLGQKRLYTLESEVQKFWESFQDFAQRLDSSLILETADIYGDINWQRPWSETKKLVKSGEVTLLDVRPLDEIIDDRESDIVMHISQEELKSNLKKIPKKKILLVFCRGRLCAQSAFSVNYLRENGYNAYRLDLSWNSIKSDLRKEK